MRIMTVREMRQRWPEAVWAMAKEAAILITRDGELVVWGKGVMFDSLTGLLEDREDRKLI